MDMLGPYPLDSIITGDARELARAIPDESVDLIFTSPPYNLGGDFHRMRFGRRETFGGYAAYDDNMPEYEYQSWQIELLIDWFRVLKANGSLFYNHKVRIKGGVAIHPLTWIMQAPFVLKQEIVWELGTRNLDKRRFLPCSERIYWLTKRADTRIDNATCIRDVLRITPDTEVSKDDHPAVMPVSLAVSIIACTSGAIVLDPFMGTGTTAIASRRLGRSFLGFEIDPATADRARARVLATQPPLFVPEFQQAELFGE